MSHDSETPHIWLWLVGVVAFCVVMNMLSRGFGETFAVFLLPLSAEFEWSRTKLRIPVHADHRFRCKPITVSRPSRSLIPVEPDHRFRCQADHFLAVTGIVH